MRSPSACSILFAFLVLSHGTAMARVDCFSACTGDLNADGAVDGADLGLLLGGWGGADLDLDGNLTVNGGDLGVLLAAWGECDSASAGKCPPSNHGCTTEGAAGCTDAVCCETICASDPFCCAIAWDAICAGAASIICPTDCCLPHASPGCSSTSCTRDVCSFSPSCCEIEWDSSCADLAITLCIDACPSLPGLPLVIDALAPVSAAEGDVITITGQNFPEDPNALCVMVVSPSGQVVGARAESATSNAITIRVGPVPEGFDAGNVKIALGDGVVYESLPLPEGVTIMPPGVWSWIQSSPIDGFPLQSQVARSAECVELAPSAPTSCPPLSGVVENGSLVVTVPDSILAQDGVASGQVLVYDIHGRIDIKMIIEFDIFVYVDGCGCFVPVHVTVCAMVDISFWLHAIYKFPALGAPGDPLAGVAEQIGESLRAVLSSVPGGQVSILPPSVEVIPGQGVAKVALTPEGDESFVGAGVFNVHVCPSGP